MYTWIGVCFIFVCVVVRENGPLRDCGCGDFLGTEKAQERSRRLAELAHSSSGLHRDPGSGRETSVALLAQEGTAAQRPVALDEADLAMLVLVQQR